MSDEEAYLDDSDADKRAYHNLLERKRRDHIKDSFSSLRDSLPAFKDGSSRTSRAQILMKAADYIQTTRRKNEGHSADIDDLRRQNRALEEAIKSMKEAKESGNYEAVYKILNAHGHYCTEYKRMANFDTESDDSEDNMNSEPDDGNKKKRIKSSHDT